MFGTQFGSSVDILVYPLHIDFENHRYSLVLISPPDSKNNAEVNVAITVLTKNTCSEQIQPSVHACPALTQIRLSAEQVLKLFMIDGIVSLV